MGLVELGTLPELQLSEGVLARVVTGQSMSVAYVRLAAGAEVPEHSHANEQIVNVLDGQLNLTVDGELFQLVAGKVMVLPANVPHSARAVTNCRVIDVFHPVREDFRAATFGGYKDGAR